MAGAVKIGIIGGTGLENPEILHNAVDKDVDTPFGKPSDLLKIGEISGVPCVLLSRHGRKHDKSPTTVNYRANLWALYQEGVTHILTTTACGSLREELPPGHLVFLDSAIDKTHRREGTFFDGLPGHPIGVCHTPMHPMFDIELRKILIATATELSIPHQKDGFAVCIEGPRFSTKAESNLYRSWGASLVNMTIFPEVQLAREMGIPYASTALVTDYDCWRESDDVEPEHVSVDLVMKTFAENAVKAMALFQGAIKKIAARDWTKHNAELKTVAKAAVMIPYGDPTPAHLELKK
uniref:S-methyl-5'-thioadenosine phosphorylase n=1 Tax=Plectus sambesii TaxID=2011161 RepID=A0A914V2L1_9BILA